MSGLDLGFRVASLAAIWFGWQVFRTDSMVRASFSLLASLLAVAVIMVLLLAEYLGLALAFMVATEMTVMALFMVAFMMNPAGLNPMSMVHQPRVALGVGLLGAAGLAVVAVVAELPARPRTDATGSIAALGSELLGGSMLIFESAGVALLATMLGAVILSARSSRHGGPADEGSRPPPIDPTAAAGYAFVATRLGGLGLWVAAGVTVAVTGTLGFDALPQVATTPWGHAMAAGSMRTGSEEARRLALTGATLEMVAHALITGALLVTAALFVELLQQAFLGRTRPATATIGDLGVVETAVLVVLLGLTVVIGVAPAFVLEPIDGASRILVGTP